MKKKIFLFLLVLFTSTLFAEDYYWRGNQGEWSTITKWMLANGSIPEALPTESDNVIFDMYSFLEKDTLFINSQNPTCNNITFINIPDSVVIAGGTGLNDFNIFGSFISHQNIINSYRGNYVFMSQLSGNKIKSNGSRFTTNLHFEGIGEWKLMDNIYVFADDVTWDDVVAITSDFDIENDELIMSTGPQIIQKSGTLNSNGFKINTRGFRTKGSKSRSEENIDKLMKEEGVDYDEAFDRTSSLDDMAYDSKYVEII